MNCIRTDLEREVRLGISGALDALTVQDVRPILDAVSADRPRRVTLDFAELSILDSSGVGAVVSLYKRIKAHGGEVVIVRAHDQPLLVLQALGLDVVFSMDRGSR